MFQKSIIMALISIFFMGCLTTDYNQRTSQYKTSNQTNKGINFSQTKEDYGLTIKVEADNRFYTYDYTYEKLKKKAADEVIGYGYRYFEVYAIDIQNFGGKYNGYIVLSFADNMFPMDPNNIVYDTYSLTSKRLPEKIEYEKFVQNWYDDFEDIYQVYLNIISKDFSRSVTVGCIFHERKEYPGLMLTHTIITNDSIPYTGLKIKINETIHETVRIADNLTTLDNGKFKHEIFLYDNIYDSFPNEILTDHVQFETYVYKIINENGSERLYRLDNDELKLLNWFFNYRLLEATSKYITKDF